jgi:lysyl-tRNA synthetase class 2
MPSTAIRDIRYNTEREQLQITFVSGRTYVYLNVPESIYGAFTTSASKGVFFNRFIRDRFRHRELTKLAS